MATFASTYALANGRVYAGRDGDSFHAVQYHSQGATLRHDRGRETLIISLQTKIAENERAVWIFPIRGDSGNAAVEMLDTVPFFRGSDPIKKWQDEIEEIVALAWLPQVYSAFFMPMIIIRCDDCFPPFTYGLRARPEILRTDTMDALRTRLLAQGVRLPEAELSAFAPYCNAEHNLVLCWMEDQVDLLGSDADEAGWHGAYAPCLRVDFDTPEPWFPLSVAGDGVSERQYQSLVLLGLYDIQTGSKPANPNWIRHLYGSDHHAVPITHEEARAGKMAFTEVLLDLHAAGATLDLVFQPSENSRFHRAIDLRQRLPKGIVLAYIILVLIVAFSYLSGGLAGVVVYRRWQPYALAGLWNCCTVIALWIVAWRWSRQPATNGGPTHYLLRPYGYVVMFMVFYFACIAATYQAANAIL